MGGGCAKPQAVIWRREGVFSSRRVLAKWSARIDYADNSAAWCIFVVKSPSKNWYAFGNLPKMEVCTVVFRASRDQGLWGHSRINL